MNNKMNNKEMWKKVGIGASKALLIGLALGGMAALSPVGGGWMIGKVMDVYEGVETRRYKKDEIKRAVRYLRSRKLIDVEKQYQKEVYSLTALGKRKVRKLLKSFAVLKPAKWDGKWRMVVFDIPDLKKDKADTFRRQLKSLGLLNLQKSIWIHPYECREQVYYLAGNLFIKQHVRYIVASEVTGDRDLRWRFDL